MKSVFKALNILQRHNEYWPEPIIPIGGPSTTMSAPTEIAISALSWRGNIYGMPRPLRSNKPGTIATNNELGNICFAVFMQ